MADSERSWDVIKEEAFKVTNLEETKNFLHVAECCEKELTEDLQKVRGSIVILKERITELQGAQERKPLAAALRRKQQPVTLGAGDDL